MESERTIFKQGNTSFLTITKKKYDRNMQSLIRKPKLIHNYH